MKEGAKKCTAWASASCVSLWNSIASPRPKNEETLAGQLAQKAKKTRINGEKLGFAHYLNRIKSAGTPAEWWPPCPPQSLSD
jgi:hypothetical protein